MAISLYEASVPSYLQMLGAVEALLAKTLVYCQTNGIDPETIVETRLAPDMFPFRFQVQSVAHHTNGAIEGIISGQFGPPANLPAHDFAGLQALIAAAKDAVEQVTPGEINARSGAEVAFKGRARSMTFTAESFVLSFSLPNLHFHAATAYDILRGLGLPIGKGDYLGVVRVKG